jgi:hypothetical protein
MRGDDSLDELRGLLFVLVALLDFPSSLPPLFSPLRFSPTLDERGFGSTVFNFTALLGMLGSANLL